MPEAPAAPPQRARLVRIAPFTGAPVRLLVDGREVEAREGESVLSAVLAVSGHLRELDSNGEKRAGFCLMGACQDCWVVVEGLGRVRACATLAEDGMKVRRG